MSHFQKSPIASLGYHSLLDYGIFKKYLRLPKPYLLGLLQRYPNSLKEVPLNLPTLIEECHAAYWRKLKDMELTDAEKVMNVKYKIAGVPPLYIARRELPACAGPTLGLVSQIIDDPSVFAGTGRVLYFHSEFEDNSLLAASSIIKSGIWNGVKCSMMPFTTYMSKIKEWSDGEDGLKNIKNADLSALILLGSEYRNAESGFTEFTLIEFVRNRQVAGKSTILSSHLSPVEFEARYFSLDRLGAITCKFEDEGMKVTVGQLAKELAEIKKRKEGK